MRSRGRASLSLRCNFRASGVRYGMTQRFGLRDLTSLSLLGRASWFGLGRSVEQARELVQGQDLRRVGVGRVHRIRARRSWSGSGSSAVVVGRGVDRLRIRLTCVVSALYVVLPGWRFQASGLTGWHGWMTPRVYAVCPIAIAIAITTTTFCIHGMHSLQLLVARVPRLTDIAVVP